MGVIIFPFWYHFGDVRFSARIVFELEGAFVGKRRKKVWQAAPCLFWTMWKAVNRIVFRNAFCRYRTSNQCLFFCFR